MTDTAKKQEQNILKREENIKQKLLKANALQRFFIYFFNPFEYYTENDLFQEEDRAYLQKFLKTGQRAQKELDFIRKQSDLHGFEYDEIKKNYVNDFLPASKNSNTDDKLMHNLLIALLDYAEELKLTSFVAGELIKTFSTILAGDNFYPNNISEYDYKYPGLKNELDEVWKGTRNKSKNNLLTNFAFNIHYKYGNKQRESLFKELNKEKNAQYDKIDLSKIIPVSENKLIQLLESILTGKFAETKKQIRYNNSFEFDKYIGEPNFSPTLIKDGTVDSKGYKPLFTPEEYRKIYGQIEMYVPFKNTEIRSLPPKPSARTEPNSVDVPADINKSVSDNSYQNNNTFNFNIQSVDPRLAAEEIRQVLTGVFDEFNLVQGYYNEN